MNTDQLSSQSYHKWYIYIIILIATVGITLLVGYLFINTPDYKSNQDEIATGANNITQIPGADIPLINDAISEIPLLEKQSLAEPVNPEPLRQKARNYVIMDDLNNAARTYEQESLINDTDPVLYKELGSVYTQLQETDKAIISYLKSIKIDPVDNSSYIDLANIYTIQKPDRYKVIATYTQAINANPHNITFRILFAGFYEQIGENQLALQQYQKVLTIDPSNVISLQKVDQLTKN